MTDRTRHLMVLLDRDYRVDDDAKAIVEAIEMIRGVDQVKVGPPPDTMARASAKQELRQELREFIEKLWKR